MIYIFSKHIFNDTNPSFSHRSNIRLEFNSNKAAIIYGKANGYPLVSLFISSTNCKIIYDSGVTIPL